MKKKSKKLVLAAMVGIFMSGSAFAGCHIGKACIIAGGYWCFDQVICDEP